ncbi:hypothetical protein IV203_009794 [Nitzschia inconspicua]|uniref:Uncharacterized protein n=1 Tax=Nitzschia inconspicua TaxID=303405 RepID=A0A9K3KUW0_9STRA|nr:hypothetical protein IV203_009794 [Nitzschia inconspicua]
MYPWKEEKKPKGEPSSTERHPGAVYTTTATTSERKTHEKIVSRGIDLTDVDRPERLKSTNPTNCKNDSFVANPTPPSYVSRREARRQAADYDVSQEMMLYDDKDEGNNNGSNESKNYPGAVSVPGMYSQSNQGVERNTQHTRHSESYSITDVTSVVSADETQAEAIVAAQLVEDMEKQDRAKIRQEIFNEAEQAEVVDVKRQKRFYLWLTCLCVLVLAGIGVGVAFLFMTRTVELNNSVCGSSAPLSLGDTISGSVGNADVSQIRTCGPTQPNGDVRGRWFIVIGDGSSVTASTCGRTNFDSQISIYNGNSCATMTCVAFNDDNSSCCASGDDTCNGNAAAVTISTIVDEKYYVFVHGTNVSSDATFELQLSSSSAGTTRNLSCGTAIDNIIFFGDNNIQGSTEFATFNELPLCGTVQNNGAGLWYQVSGTGDVMATSTCDSTGTLDDAQVSVFEGECANLQCVQGNNVVCGESKSTFSWQSVLGTTYYIYVHSSSSQKGTFDVQLKSIGTQPDYDQQCLEETKDFYNSGLQTELKAITQSMIDGNPTTACRTMPDYTVLCVIDALNGMENDVDTVCLGLGGRYIIKYFSLNCESQEFEVPLKLRFTNYPDCASFLCSDEWIDDSLRKIANQLIPILERSARMMCELGDLSWTDGVQ